MESGFRNFIFEIFVEDFQDFISEIASDTPNIVDQRLCLSFHTPWMFNPCQTNKMASSMQVDNVLVQLRNTDPVSFQNFFRMDIAKFEEVLALISTLIERRDTNYREAGKRLTVTLRFLATGQNTDAAVARSSASRTTVSCSGIHCIAYTLS